MAFNSSDQISFSITTPIYYVNDLPHIGSAYTTMAADALARFHRLLGRTALMVTGTDEHGQKIQRTAEAAGQPPQDYCDAIAAKFEELWDLLNIARDRFMRTTSTAHEAIVREFFQRVYDAGDIYSGQQQGWYCVSCEEFKEDKELLPGNFCPLHPTKEVEWRDEQNYFFRLSKYQSQLEQFYADNPDFIQPESRRNEILSFVSSGLRDFSISRVNVDWGIPLPIDPSHTIYVWFDALLIYMTATLPPEVLATGQTTGATVEQALSNGWPIHTHLIGKDILRFHAVYWPAMLMSAGLPLPKRVFAHGFLTKDGQKMSKSLGNVIDPYDLSRRYGSDAVRYYFLKEIEFGRDGDFSEQRFVNTLNADLANDLGNLLNRTLKMVIKYCDGQLPDIQVADIPADDLLYSKAKILGDEVAQAYDSLAFSQACEAILAVARAGNKYIDEQAPWSLYKKGEQAAVERVLYTVLETVRLAAYLLSPVTPNIANAVYRQLGFSADFNQPDVAAQCPFAQHSQWGVLSAERSLGEAQPIFQRVELPEPATA